MIGEVAAISCAFCWALSSSLIRSLAGKMPSLTLNATRSGVAMVFFAVFLGLSGKYSFLAEIGARDILFIGINLGVGLVIGDTIYYSSMRLIGVSRALTISATYPLLTAIIAGVFLDEIFTLKTWAGFVLCIGGVLLVARSGVQSETGEKQPGWGRGVGLAVAASICWAIGTVALRVGSMNVDPFVVSAIRLSGVAVIAGTWAGARGELRIAKDLTRRDLLLLLTSSLIGSVIGATLYVSSVKLAGASKAAVLASTAPLFSVPMTVIAGEKVNKGLIGGMVAAVVGVMLVV